LHQLARRLLGQRAGRPGRARAHRPLRPGVARRRPPQAGPGRPGPGDRGARHAQLRDHRGPGPRLGLGRGRRVLRGGRRVGRGAARLVPAGRAAADRPAVLPLAAVLRGGADRGHRQVTAGLFLVPMAVLMACSAPLCGRVIAARGTRVPLLIAGAGITAGGVLLTFVTAASPAWYVLLCCVVLGAGMGWVNAPVTNNAVAGMPRARAGTAAGIASTARQVGSSLGVAVTG